MHKSIGKRIREYRENLKLSQTEFGLKLGNFKQSDITNAETGRVDIGIDLLIALHNTFNIDINWLITGNKQYTLNDDQNELMEGCEGYQNDIKRIKIDIDLLKEHLYLLEQKLKLK